MLHSSSEYTKLREGLATLGLCPGDTVLVHSSMKALGTALTPDQVIDCLQEAVGEEGTLLFPALTYENVNRGNPVFDSEATEPCVGLLPRVFWKRPGVERSLNPTHSVCAWGRLAHRLTVGHAMDDVAVGPHSPFMLLPVVGGKLLFIGEVLHACTFMHGIEEIVNPPYIRRHGLCAYTVNGKEELYQVRRDFGWGSEFQRVGDILEEPDIRRGRLLAADSTLIDSRALLAAALAEMRSNPYAFVTDISKWI